MECNLAVTIKDCGYRPSGEVSSSGEVSRCWIYNGFTTPTGYGLKWSARTNDNLPAHVWVWEELYGQVPEGLELDHLCRNRSCVCPTHVEMVSHAENIQRSPLMTHLKPDDIRNIRQSTEKQKVLAAHYEVNQSQISRIKNRHIWQNVLDVPDEIATSDQ